MEPGSRHQVFLSWIRGILGLLAAIELLAVAYVLQILLNSLSSATGFIPAEVVPFLVLLQLTVFVGGSAAILLVIGLAIRLRQRPPPAPYLVPGPQPFPAAAPEPLTPAAVTLVCPQCGTEGAFAFCPNDGSTMVARV